MRKAAAAAEKLETFNNVSDDGAWAIKTEEPYQATVVVKGVAPILFHRWSVDAVKAKADAAKGSKAKKEDDVESYVHRNEKGELCVPGTYLTGAIAHAARFRQDPRSPRKSALEIVRAGVIPLTELCGLGTKDWDYLDRRRVMVQRNGITRTRPAMNAGWQIRCQLQIELPEYISPAFLHDLLTMAGRLGGLGDFRPTFGRFQLVQFSVDAVG